MRINANVSNVMPKKVGINNPNRRAIKLNILWCTSISRLGRFDTVNVDGVERSSYLLHLGGGEVIGVSGLWV